MIVVPHTPTAEVAVLVDRLLGAVRELEAPGVGRFTLSAGISSAEAGGTLFHDELQRCAEAALAESIGAGGDRSTSRPPETAK